jgi:hypothetical protein
MAGVTHSFFVGWRIVVLGYPDCTDGFLIILTALGIGDLVYIYFIENVNKK